MIWHLQRKAIGDPHIFGSGVEIGAGLHPVMHDGIKEIVFIDKCDSNEFQLKFGSAPNYQILSIGEVSEKFPGGVDFVTCHHVLEHIAEPISEIMQWISILKKKDGVLYFSIPSENAEYEIDRLLTPLDHILEDYFFERGESNYSSKQHIYSFALNWSEDGSPGKPWYAENPVSEFSKTLLQEVKLRNNHDLHWHTYSLEVIKEVVEISFYLAGIDYEILLAKEYAEHKSCYLAFRTNGTRKKENIPLGLKNFQTKILKVMSNMEKLFE